MTARSTSAALARCHPAHALWGDGAVEDRSGKIAVAIPYANRPSPHGICEPPLKRYAMQILFGIGILICHHVSVPVGIYLKERDIL